MCVATALQLMRLTVSVHGLLLVLGGHCPGDQYVLLPVAVRLGIGRAQPCTYGMAELKV
jgi:hypothetical protein